jgi:lipopolysaccharide transport system ATP-binding protein
MLEVSAGFHHELTGRENVFLSGAILGMSQREIAGRFDRIVEYAEIEDAIDTPVKRYSSGMTARLAFAVAAHLEAEIMLVDEVLAVGDTAFRAKCLDTMRSLARSGRSIIFVSHELDMLERLCDRAILIEHGRIVADGPPKNLVGLHRGDDDVPEWIPA